MGAIINFGGWPAANLIKQASVSKRVLQKFLKGGGRSYIMNKRVGIAFSIILIFSITCVFSQSSVSLNLNKGWNLVSSLTNPQQIISENNQNKITAIYALIPQTQEYVRIYPNPEENKIAQIGDKFIEETALWVYSSQDVTIQYNPQPFLLKDHQLYKGWNFIGITGEMVGKTLNQIKGDCEWTGIYTYAKDAGRLQWLDLLNNPNFVDKEQLIQDNIGLGLAIKVSDNCRLGITEEVIPSVPQLPQ